MPATAAPLDAFITAATPSIIELLGAFLTAAIALAARTARQKWGIEIEAKHREALQSAILTGARLAIAGRLDTAAAIQLILKHVSVSVPDAVTALQPSAEVLENLARAKLQEAAQIVGTDKLTDAMRKPLAG
ncbi:hypothetical protein IB235_16235 [Paracoccus sp. PAR01]|nr:hypothetical protein [Paracoccus sp. PAR01]